MTKKYDPLITARERYGIALENQRSKFTKFNDFDYIFHSRLEKADPNIPSRVFNPILWSFIDTIMSRMLAKKPVIAYKPREETDKEQAELFSELFSYWFDRAGAFPILSDFIKQALIYGTSVLKVDWYSSPKRIVKSFEIDPETGEAMFDEMSGAYMVKQDEVTDYDDPRIQNVNIYDFFFDPNATTIDDAQWVIHQYYTTVAELRAINGANPEPIYKEAVLKELEKYEADGAKSEAESYESTRRTAAGYDNRDNTRGRGRVKIWEMWENNKLCVIADENYVLREGENPFWHGMKPFIRYIDSSNTLEFYGKGEIEPVEKLVHWLNTNINQRVTNINQILSPVWKSRGSGADDSELQFIPNNIIHVTDMNDVEILRQNDVTATSFQEQATIIETIQRALGVTDYTQGLATPGNTKAEVEIKTAQSNARFSAKLMNFEEMALKPLGQMVYMLYQQYVVREKIVRIVGTEGERFIRLTPADLSGRFDVVPESGSTLETDQEQIFRKSLNLAMFLQGKPHINQIEVDKKVVEDSGEKDPEKFFIQQPQGGVDEFGNPIGAIPGLTGGGPPEATGSPEETLGVGQIL